MYRYGKKGEGGVTEVLTQCSSCTAALNRFHLILCPSVLQASAPQQSDRVEGSSVEDEPTSVSQYFLSDIFTEVDEG